MKKEIQESRKLAAWNSDSPSLGYGVDPMGRRKDCPLPGLEDAFIVLPDEWFGIHAVRRDQAVAISTGEEGKTLELFAIALALLDDWGGIPGLEGNPENWDFTKLKLEIIAWINETVLLDFNMAFIVPKNSSSPSPSGSMATTPEELIKAPGHSEKKGSK